MAFQVSPGVNVSEIDLTTSIPATSVSTGAFAGPFSWGPALIPVTITNEVQLAARFGKPDNITATSYFTAASFLAYSNDLRVVRSYANNANNSVSSGTAIVIKNEEDYFNNHSGSSAIAWTARYPGSLGNSLRVITWGATSDWAANTSDPTDPLYQFATLFDHAPATSPYAENVTGNPVLDDEIHVLVVDENGLFTGTANTVLEKYVSLSVLSDAKQPDGSSNYYREVLYRKSKYVYATGIPSDGVTGWGATTANVTSIHGETQANVASLTLGTNGTLTQASYEDALDVFGNQEFVDISLLMTGDVTNIVSSYAIDNIGEVRKDCVVFVSPSFYSTTDVTDPGAAIAAYADTVTRSSYAVMDSGWKYMYDKYNDVYRWIPLNGDLAGLCARTDNVRDPWYSPAGLQRGVIKNVVKLAFNPNKAQRDTLYKAGVNPVVSFPGEGTLLFGDKTLQNRPSAFDRINVRRLFIVLEKAISRAARSSLFEFNDQFTRAQFVSLVEPFLRTVKGRRGITDFKVVCDTTNNTPEIIDSNQFVGDIYIKPARSINFIQLNFVAVRTGVTFDEVVGKF
jgi:phage tail sheath protein FI